MKKVSTLLLVIIMIGWLMPLACGASALAEDAALEYTSKQGKITVTMTSTKTSMSCEFSGIAPDKESLLVSALIFYANSNGVKDFSISITSGQNSGEIVYSGGDFETFETPDGYSVLDHSNTDVLMAYMELQSGLKSASSSKSKITATPKPKNEVTVVSQYSWSSSYYHYVGLVLKNNTENTVEISVQVVFRDKAGKIIGAKNYSQEAVGSGCEVPMVISNDESFASVDYEVKTAPDKYYTSVIQNLTYSVSTTSKKAIVSVTNKGQSAAKFVEVYVLFLKNGKVVAYDRKYAIDSDNELKPGKTEIREMSAYQAFDEVKVYFTGRGTR